MRARIHRSPETTRSAADSLTASVRLDAMQEHGLNVRRGFPGDTATGSAGESTRRECAVRAIKIAGIVLVSYVLIVVAFESLIGFFQPEAPGDTLVLTTVGEDGGAVDRVLQALHSNGQLYVAVNHWPRAWHRRALANPRVQVTRDGETRNYMAVPVTGEEYAQVDGEHPRPFRVPPPDRLSASPADAAGPGGVTDRRPAPAGARFA